MDLFHADKDFSEIKEWADVNQELPKEETGIFKVKLLTGDEIRAYYCADKCITLMSYSSREPSYWYTKGSGEPIYNVTHWGKD